MDPKFPFFEYQYFDIDLTSILDEIKKWYIQFETMKYNKLLMMQHLYITE